MSRQMCPEKLEPTPCDCPVGSCTLREVRELREDGGRERTMARYYGLVAERAAEREQEREGQKDPQDLPYRLQKIGVPFEDIHALRGTLVDTRSLRAAKEFISRPKGSQVRFLLLLGDKSVGKSLAAAYVIRDAARHHDWNGQATGASTEPIQFVRAGDLTRIDSHDRLDTARLNEMARCRLLALDDMGDEGGPVGRGALADTILKRDAAGRPTVMTTNLKVERFAETYGAPLMARINARGIVPNLAGEKPMRKKERAA